MCFIQIFDSDNYKLIKNIQIVIFHQIIYNEKIDYECFSPFPRKHLLIQRNNFTILNFRP